MPHGGTDPMVSDGAERPAVAPSALDALRHATSRNHRRLEEIPLNARLLSDDYGLAEYRVMLQRTYGFYLPLTIAAERHAATWAPRARRRTEQLAGDLFDFGLSPHDLRDSARCVDLPALDTPDRRWGTGYVIEGAALGGRVIVKHLARVFGGERNVPLRFFSGDGDQTGSRWRQFCQQLEAHASDLTELCAAANDAFDALAAWLTAACAAGPAPPTAW